MAEDNQCPAFYCQLCRQTFNCQQQRQWLSVELLLNVLSASAVCVSSGLSGFGPHAARARHKLSQLKHKKG